VPQPFEVLALPGRQRPEHQPGRTETRRPEERTAPSKRDSPGNSHCAPTGAISREFRVQSGLANHRRRRQTKERVDTRDAGTGDSSATGGSGPRFLVRGDAGTRRRFRSVRRLRKEPGGRIDEEEAIQLGPGGLGVASEEWSTLRRFRTLKKSVFGEQVTWAAGSP
jgi:hypothetical protein